MNRAALHPNTSTLLTAWERMTESPDSYGLGPRTSDHPDLIDGLFVIERSPEHYWLFRNAGPKISQTLGRELAEHDYLDFWTGEDRVMMNAFLNSVIESRKPGVATASGETLTGQRTDIEITFAPVSGLQTHRPVPRLLGLYQILGAESALKGRPLWRHRVTAVYPPSPSEDIARIRLITNNA